MYASFEVIYGDIVLKLKIFLVEEGENEINVSGPQNFIYAFSDTVGEGHCWNRVKSVIYLSTGEVTAPPATGKDILPESDGKIRMQYVLSDPDPDVGDGTQGTMDVTLTVSYTVGFVDLGFPDKEQGMVGAQTIVGIPQYNMIVKYELKG